MPEHMYTAATRCLLGARPTAEDPDGSVCMRPNPHSKGYAGWARSWRWWRSLSAERPSHRPRRWLGPWPLAVPTRASPQCLTRTHAPQSGCMAVLGYRCTAFNWGAISRPQASYTGLHPTDARSKSEYSLTHSLTNSSLVKRGDTALPLSVRAAVRGSLPDSSRHTSCSRL